MSRVVALGLAAASIAGAVAATLRHPLAAPYVPLACFAGYLAWHRESAALLLTGVLGAGVGAMFGDTAFGPPGMAVSFVVVLAGVALNHAHPAALGAMPAAIAPFPLTVFAVEAQSIGLVLLAAFAPAMVWLSLVSMGLKRGVEAKVAK